MLEAVFRHQFNKNASARPRNVEYFFLSLDANTDPPPELLTRFNDVKPVVLPVSLVKESPDEGVVHKDGGRGLIYQITSVAWLDADTAQVEGGHYAGLWSASGNTYRVTRTNGAWKVTSEVMNWIS